MGRAGLMMPLLLAVCTLPPSMAAMVPAWGAGTGLLFGALAGTGAAGSSSYGMRRRYDNAYQQCMYASGHKVPVAGQMLSGVPAKAATPPPRS